MLFKCFYFKKKSSDYFWIAFGIEAIFWENILFFDIIENVSDI